MCTVHRTAVLADHVQFRFEEKPFGTSNCVCTEMLQLEGQGPSTKTQDPPSAVFGADTAQTAGRFWLFRSGLSHLDPPVERPRTTHISLTLAEPSIWWPSVELSSWLGAACG